MLTDTVIDKCAPTMAGLKTGNLFGYRSDSKIELLDAIRQLNTALVPRGARLTMLSWDGRRALLYMYRPSMLRQDMDSPLARQLLTSLGYPVGNAARCVMRLQRRLNEGGEFPHEVGLFLGYPAVDVYGFILNNAARARYEGAWKVYGDVEDAIRRFHMYRNCTRYFQSRYERNHSFDNLIANE